MNDKNIKMVKWIWTEYEIGDSGAKMISEALKINSTLTQLNLGGDENWSKWNEYF